LHDHSTFAWEGADAAPLVAWRPELERLRFTAETRRQFDPEFRAGAVHIVRETGKSIGQVTHDLGINNGWPTGVKRDRESRGEAAAGQLAEDERTELARLRRENAELAMKCDGVFHGWSVGRALQEPRKRPRFRQVIGRRAGADPSGKGQWAKSSVKYVLDRHDAAQGPA
jgi:transposase